MSTINKKAFISKVLESLTSEQLTTLKGLVNGSTEPTFKSLINSTYGITSSDKGVKHIILETEERTFSGYLIYNNTYCMMITYALNTQELSMFHILLNDKKVKAVSEYLDIDELRTLLDDSLIDGKVEALSSTGLKREVVEALPTGSAIQSNVIYLVPAQDTSTGNVYDEYMYINNSWEKIGSSATSGGSGVIILDFTPGQGISSPLTEEQYAIIAGDNCIIKRIEGSTTWWYTKHSEDSTNIYYVSTRQLNYGNTLYWAEISFNKSDYSFNRNNVYEKYFVQPNVASAGPTYDLKILKIGNNWYRPLPEYPSTTGTYVLKLVNGTLTWVQE